MKRICVTVLLLAIALPAAAADPAVKCEVGKLKEAGKYSNCRFKADAKAVQKMTPADYSKCDAKLADKWNTLETKYGAACPPATLGNVQAFLTTCSEDALAPTTYEVVFRLDATPVPLSAMQFEVDYAGAAGEFVGIDGGCVNLNGGAVHASTNDVGTTTLSIGQLSFGNFGVTDLAACTFSRTGAVPVAGDFGITVVDATDGDGFLVDLNLVDVIVKSVTPQ